MRNSPIPAERWRGILWEQRASGLSVAAFCRRAGISPASFYGWRRRLRNGPRYTSGPRRTSGRMHTDRSPEATESALAKWSGMLRSGVQPNRGGDGPAGSMVAGFVEVKRPAEAIAEASAIELRLPGDRFLVIRPGFDRVTLLDLLAALEAREASVAEGSANLRSSPMRRDETWSDHRRRLRQRRREARA